MMVNNALQVVFLGRLLAVRGRKGVKRQGFCDGDRGLVLLKYIFNSRGAVQWRSILVITWDGFLYNDKTFKMQE